MLADDPERFREYTRRWKRDDADGAKKRRQYENRQRWLAENPGKVAEYKLRRQEAQRLDRLAQGRVQYQRMMADPEKKAKERARIRDLKRAKAKETE